MTPDAFVSRLRSERAVAILRCNATALARRAMQAAIAGGFRLIEFTLSIPGAFELIEEFSAADRVDGAEIVVGTGTVLEVEEARAAVRAGARFLVSPVTDAEVIAEARELGVAILPGAQTPTEMLAAHRAGAPLIKLFPQPATGPAYVQQLLGPLPFLKIVPTSGVNEDNAGAFIEAGAWAVGCVRSLFAPAELAVGNVEGIEARARRLLAAARAATPPAKA